MIEAVQDVKAMRGGAQSRMMRCDDGHFYVVKFQNNPQHPRVLANDFFGTRLAAQLGLPVPEVAPIHVGEPLVENTRALTMHVGNHEVRCAAGLHFGSRWVVDPQQGQVLDYLPEDLMVEVKNRDDFAGALVFDKWTCNADGRQVAYSRLRCHKKYSATFIDQGYCFNAAEWSFVDAPLRGIFVNNSVYVGITGWESFEPWITLAEQMSSETIARCTKGIPLEWCGNDRFGLELLVDELSKRKKKIRRLIDDFRRSSRMPFPHWRERESCTVPLTWASPGRIAAMGWA